MMKRNNFHYYFFLFAAQVFFHTLSAQIVEKQEVKRIIETLSADDMRGRAALSQDIERAAEFIADEFKTAGLEPYAEKNYRQTFQMTKIHSSGQQVIVNGTTLKPEDFVLISSSPQLSWNQDSTIQALEIKEGEDFSQRFREIVRHNPHSTIVWVHPSFEGLLKRFKKIFPTESLVPKQNSPAEGPSKVFIVKKEPIHTFQVSASTHREDFPLFNVAATLPGKSKADEFVIFSAHYDHIGVLAAVDQDSIANGADDDASGTTAVISLAKHFKQWNQHERTLLFVAFTAEEVGMFGSKYFSNQIDPDKVVAMINIEMIGKDSKFGPNSLYMTGYNASNLGQLMQEKLEGTAFTFHPDPYPQQNLFYRSDNAILAALGVPAHTFSTVQIDQDNYYHTVNDEIETLDVDNIVSSIEAIAKGVEGIVQGTQTPSRVEKLKD